jgi:hypothetical protein
VLYVFADVDTRAHKKNVSLRICVALTASVLVLVDAPCAHTATTVAAVHDDDEDNAKATASPVLSGLAVTVLLLPPLDIFKAIVMVVASYAYTCSVGVPGGTIHGKSCIEASAGVVTLYRAITRAVARKGSRTYDDDVRDTDALTIPIQIIAVGSSPAKADVASDTRTVAFVVLVINAVGCTGRESVRLQSYNGAAVPTPNTQTKDAGTRFVDEESAMGNVCDAAPASTILSLRFDTTRGSVYMVDPRPTASSDAKGEVQQSGTVADAVLGSEPTFQVILNHA